MSICKAWSAVESKAVDFSNQHHRFFDEIKKDIFWNYAFRALRFSFNLSIT
jgi:hypothetical protein